MNKLKIALQKSGRLSEKSLELLKECGIQIPDFKSKLKNSATNFPLEILFLRDDDIPKYVEQGIVDVGIIGENEVLEQNKNIDVVRKLGFATCRLSLAIPKEQEYSDLSFSREKSGAVPPGINRRVQGSDSLYATANPAILYTAQLCGISRIFKVGGAQAIAAMTVGTESIPKVDKIFGPGNQYVTLAKQLAMEYNVAIDLPAGPSEVLIIADEKANPEFCAADLLSQAEHGTDSQVIFIATDEIIFNQTLKEIEKQVAGLPRQIIAKFALENSHFILLKSIDEALEMSNFYAPEHLILAVENSRNYISKITNAGSVFLGNYTPEAAGDYASGTNHTLPTNGFAKNYSGVSLDSFIKKITIQEISKTGIQNIGKSIELMAAAEGLDAHKNAVSIRLKSLENEI